MNPNGPVNMGNFPSDVSNKFAVDQQSTKDFREKIEGVSPGVLRSATKLILKPQVQHITKLLGLDILVRWAFSSEPATFREQTNHNPLQSLGSIDQIKNTALPRLESLMNQTTDPEQKETLQLVHDLMQHAIIPIINWQTEAYNRINGFKQA